MTTDSLHDLLILLWRDLVARGIECTACDGESVRVLSAGRIDEGQRGCCMGAEVSIDGVMCRGDVVTGPKHPGTTDAVLQVVAAPGVPRISMPSGLFVPQIEVDIPRCAVESLERLEAGAEYYHCGELLGAMEPIHRMGVLTGLLVERLSRKTRDIARIHDRSEGSWEQTFYVMLLRYMGGNTNREAFTELARRVPYAAVMHERDSLQRVEAMLLSGSGLLENYGTDDYVTHLRREFDYLARKHSIEPMSPAAWKFSRINPRNHPVLRLVQVAAFVADSDFLFSNMLECCEPEDVVKFFRAEASDYWTTHYVPSGISSPSPKRIGHSKAELLGINMVSPLMFAYGDFTGNEALKDRAVALIEKTAPEDNVYTRGWARAGLAADNAFCSQALIQLRTEYCDRLRCTACPLGKRVIKKRFKEVM